MRGGFEPPFRVALPRRRLALLPNRTEPERGTPDTEPTGGIEPPTSSLRVRRSSRLSYAGKCGSLEPFLELRDTLLCKDSRLRRAL